MCYKCSKPERLKALNLLTWYPSFKSSKISMNILISVSERSNAAFNHTTTMRTQPINKPERFVTKKKPKCKRRKEGKLYRQISFDFTKLKYNSK